MFHLFVQLLFALLCATTAFASPVAQPRLLKLIDNLETSWFASPVIYDLDGDGRRELIGTYYSIYVWDSEGQLLDKMAYDRYHLGRIYAPTVVADLEGDGISDIVAGGSKGRVAAYEWRDRRLQIKPGWPVTTYDGAGMQPEVRSLAGADLDNDGRIEIIAANTQTDEGEPQIYVYSSDGNLYQPPGISWQAWPRYNRSRGPGNDADANGEGNHGYGCFGENLGVGNLDDDPELEIVATFDNHQINLFDHTGVSHLASNYFLNRASAYRGNRLNWGQFIRWYDPLVEENHYHLHQGTWPHPSNEKWLQWTDSPSTIVDINGDGRNEVVAVASVEQEVPYQTKHYSVMVLEGSYGDGSRSARRAPGWETLPGSGAPQTRSDSWYPPAGIPAPTVIDLVDDSRPEIIVPMNDGYIYAFSATAQRLWRWDFRHDRALMYASEVLAADLNRDGESELIFTTYGEPESMRPGVPHGYLVILDARGQLLHDVMLPQQGTNGNGKGAPAAPTVGDLNGDGTLEIVVQSFGGHLFLYTVPDSAENDLRWATGRGGYLRQGRAASAIVPGELKILTAALPAGRVGSAYAAQLTAAGGTAPYRWSLKDSSLPPGLTLSSEGQFAGVPTGQGTFAFSLTLTDNTGLSVAKDLTIDVLPAAQAAVVRRVRVAVSWTRKRSDEYRVQGFLPAAVSPLSQGLSVSASLGGVEAISRVPLNVNGGSGAAQIRQGKASLRWDVARSRLNFTISLRRTALKKQFGLKRRSHRRGAAKLLFELALGDDLYQAVVTLPYARVVHS